MMFKVFKKAAIKWDFIGRDIATDNVVFRLHYRLTVFLLLSSCLVVTSRHVIKQQISCVADEEGEDFINTYCFIMRTFTVAELHNSSLVRAGAAAHPGVGPTRGDVIRLSYYQWVPYVLMIQAVMFYLPRWVSKRSDYSRLESTVEIMRTGKLIGDKEDIINEVKIETEKSVLRRVEWFCQRYLTMVEDRVNQPWATKLVLLEFLNFANVLLQMRATDEFLKGGFQNLGIHWWHDDHDEIDRVFPKVTKCTYRKYGPSGSIQNLDTICVTSMNYINEKLYVILWFWFIGLFIASALALVWRLLTFLLHNNRYFNRKIWCARCPLISSSPIDSKHIDIITPVLNYSDWLFLRYIRKNINKPVFDGVLALIAAEFSKRNPKVIIKSEESDYEETIHLNPYDSFKIH